MRGLTILRALVGSILLFFVLTAGAEEETLWGFELNFRPVSGRDLSESEIQRVLRQWAGEIRKNCGQCKFEEIDHKYGGRRPKHRITYPDGYWIELFQDEHRFEVTGRKASRREIKSRKDLLERDIFGVAAGLSLEAAEVGHLNMDYHTGFRGHLKLLDNFVADISNHPELGLGLFNVTSAAHAVPLASLDVLSQQAYVALHREIQEGRLRNPSDYAARMEAQVYTHNLGSYDSPQKPQGINLSSLRSSHEENWRAELRFLRAQESVETLLLGMEFFEARVRYLETRTGPVEYTVRPPPQGPVGFRARAASLSARRSVYLRLMDQMKIDPLHFLPLLHPRLQVLLWEERCPREFRKLRTPSA